MKDQAFKPVDFEPRGTAYVKHHHKMMGNAKRYMTNTPCPKCGGYQRRYVKGKKDIVSSTCTSCATDRTVKNSDKFTSISVEQRRAIEDHQARISEEGYWD